ncbi:hypothetical protein PCASD_03036 [Puccinia coronata f. sp. avenae]|uniref:DUF6589 domain-containing protein n=1 Tax=Puccinia coronata f. sp. avenae TaxID=200324 RepID=A0A2N5VGS3_9BASI|nr:hypothetical protein PCASD_03036 [Puccinia coronata f. sp. avenae]
MQQPSVLDQNILGLCKQMNSLRTKLSPKEFIHAFVLSSDSDVAYLRRHWAQPKGISSTIELVDVIGHEIKKTEVGRAAWAKFVQKEAIKILQSEEPPRGNYPLGGFHSAMLVEPHFFLLEEKEAHSRHLVEHMPFLSNTLMGMLNVDDSSIPVEAEEPIGTADRIPELDTSNIPEDIADIVYEDFNNGHEVNIICAMIAFARNCRNNGLQLHHAVQLFACGITERVQEYMNYIGLSASRSTAIAALKTLAKVQAENLKRIMANTTTLIPPTICIDNIDMEERVHQSIGHRTHTFRGTWGYLHLPNEKLIATLDPLELTLGAYHKVIEQVNSMELTPIMFLPTRAEEQFEIQVWKSQIAKVFRKQIATPINETLAIPTLPPDVELISHLAPEIHMLKLMDSSDNSAEGICQVFQSMIQQTGLTSKGFFGRFQLLDGDLATIQNFHCLRNQCAPSAFPEYRMDNIYFTLWNISSTLFKHHFGDPSNMLDCGAWQHLEALGFSLHKAIQKKDFTLMDTTYGIVTTQPDQEASANQHTPSPKP